jgi:coronin-1B/1C/6
MHNSLTHSPFIYNVGLSGGGGPFSVFSLAKPGRYDNDVPTYTGHSAPVLDFDFNPFHDNIIASASEDMTVKIWSIPEGGPTSNVSDPLVDLHGHQRKVTLLRFHPTASNVLASTSGDQSVKLWDIEKGREMNTLSDGHTDLIQDIVWDYNGSNYITSSKDKHVRICDARTAKVGSTIENAHEGSKSTKLAYLGNLDKLLTVGFTRQSQRQFKIWDPRNTSTELKRVEVDQAAGAIMPFYDCDTGLLYLAGKGDGNVRFYEIVNETPYCHAISEQRSSVSSKGMAWVPKRGLNIMGCESARLLKLTTNSVEPLSFVVPRKSDLFQDDLYPDTAASEPAHTADEWLGGSNKGPKLMSLNPAISGGAKAGTPAKAFVPSKTAAQLQAELDAANKKIAELEAKLAAAGLS